MPAEISTFSSSCNWLLCHVGDRLSGNRCREIFQCSMISEGEELICLSPVYKQMWVRLIRYICTFGHWWYVLSSSIIMCLLSWPSPCQIISCLTGSQEAVGAPWINEERRWCWDKWSDYRLKWVTMQVPDFFVSRYSMDHQWAKDDFNFLPVHFLKSTQI